MASRMMSMQEIQSAFDRLSRDNNMRSLSAVLRIGAEQIERRGKLGIFRNLVIGSGVLALAFTLVAPFAPEKMKASLQIWQIVAVVGCVASLAGLWKVRNKLEQYLEEEKNIKIMMIQASQKIVKDDSFIPTPLAEELRGTLKDAVVHSGIEVDDALSSIVDRG
ncbi:MAG TPA: hypothetical protein VK171_04215 [Fimbriimonas sp.]|nr:hypothetical protein [Fimbriimonas sp.]